MESTYGDREHPDDVDTDHRLEEIIRETIKQGGKVIVPAFAIGRTQELVYRCLLYTSPSPRDRTRNRMPSSA